MAQMLLLQNRSSGRAHGRREGFLSSLIVSLSRALLLAAASVCVQGAAANVPKPAAAPAKAESYLVEPAPAWVVPARERAGVSLEPGSMHYRVIDDQVRIDAKSEWQYTHVVRVPDDSAGLALASQIELEFDPSYQTLVLHHLEVVRDGKHLNRLDRKRLQLLQRETQLERQMLDGRMTLSVVLDDVRIGDQVDFAYSIRGANPVFDGKFVHTGWLASHKGPVALYQLRLLAPAERRIAHKVLADDVQVETRTLGNQRETVFRREAVKQMRPEPGAAFAALLPQLVQLSEFSDWAEVQRWGRSLFGQAGSGRLLDEKAAQIKAQAATRDQRLLAALDFVQKEVRYFGTEIGPNTHRPASPDKVMEQRFGDCKDKTLLLIALLRRLDIDATPTLVSLGLRAQVERMLPSPLAFDHVITRVEVDGQPLWLDGTRARQAGPLARRQAQGFGKGLVLNGEGGALSALPMPYDTERVQVRDTIFVERFADDPVLESRITYRGELAELFREAAGTRGLQQLGNDFSAAYLRIYPKLKPLGELKMEGAADDDALTFVQRYALGEFWRFPQERLMAADIVHWSLIEALQVPKSTTRKDAYSLGFAGIYRHQVVLEFPEDTFKEAQNQRWEDGDSHLTLKISAQATRRRVDHSAELRIRADQVEPQDWSAYVAKLATLMPRLANVTGVSAIPLDRLDALAQQLKATEAQMRAKRPATETQVQAQFKAVMLSAQIAGGRLPPNLKAQALTTRGVQYDHVGRFDDAQQDFAAAIELKPDNLEALNGAAVNALQRRQLEAAIAFADRALKVDMRNNEALNTRALAHYFRQELPAARADLEQMLLQDGASVRRGYPLVWLAFALKRNAQDLGVLETWTGRDQLPTDWPRPVIDFALGKSSADALVAAAKATKNPAESLCEAYFYIGEKYSVDGDAAHAAQYWRKAVDQGVVEFVEDGAARLRLAAR
jgi:lipoprotein NlpI